MTKYEDKNVEVRRTLGWLVHTLGNINLNISSSVLT